METTNITLIKLKAGEGMILTNGESYGEEVYLGALDDPDNWHEITKEEYERIQEQEEKAAAENKILDEMDLNN